MSEVVPPQRLNPEPPHSLVSRAIERAAIDGLLARVRDGVGETLALVGPPGIGKSTLLEYAACVAGDMAVCRVTGVESEMALGFAGVHQVVAPHLAGLGELPEPHRRALESALGHPSPVDDVGLYVVGLAVLGLLSRAASASPMLVAVDDAQWLDDESAKVLSFVARRLQAEPVAMLFAVWDIIGSPFPLSALPRLDIAGLEEPDAHELLTLTAGGRLDDAVAGRIMSAAEGNPLALVELAGALSPDQLQGIDPLPDPLPVGRQLEDLYSARTTQLGGETQAVLLLAAAEPLGDPNVVRAAADALGLTAWDDSVTSAEATGLVTFAPTIEFRHPLARSAVYYSAPTSQRRHAHRALADVLTSPADVDRRAWHLGAASVDPDEQVARELEVAAERARVRGGVSVAAAYLRRAAELTPDRQRATSRRLEAARAELTAGNAARAQEILERVRLAAPTKDMTTEIAWTGALVRIVTGQVGEAGSLLAEALSLAAAGSEDSTLGTLVAAVAVVLDAGHLAPEPQRLQIAEAAGRAVADRELPVAVAELLRGVAVRLTEGYVPAAPFWRGAVAAVTDGSPTVLDAVGHHVHVVYFDAVLAATDLLDDAAWADLTRSWVQLARHTGALAALPLALSMSSWLEVLEGRVRTAGSDLAELEEIVSLSGQRGLLGTPTPAAVLLQAWQGREREARAGARKMMQDAHERGEGRGIDQAQEALLVLELGSGRYEAALRIARRQADRDGVGAGTLALADIVEAAVRCGERDIGLEALERLTLRAAASGSAWAHGLLCRAQALLADGNEAEEHYRASVEHLSGCRVVTERARTRLLYGEWLRRARRRREAREPLYEALEFFEGMGASLFAARTRQELAATGERVQRGDAPVDLLTPQESQIARHAAAGDRNHEIAAQLFISTSTVEYHLRKIFVKLGVRSRTDLAALDLPA